MRNPFKREQKAEEPVKTLCKTCFENYHGHKAVEHWHCWNILTQNGARDAKPPEMGRRP